MQLTYNEVNNIFKTLPIGYYFGRNLKCFLDETETSYFDPMNEEIHIGYLMIAKSIANLEDNAENDVRALLYHELAHAMLTPKEMHTTHARNTFEDERIESLLKDYFLNVDFKEFCIRFNGFNHEDPTNADEFFYQIVRFRHGPKELVDKVHDIIIKFKHLTYNSPSWPDTNCYENAIDNFWYEVKAYWDNLQTTANQLPPERQGSSFEPNEGDEQNEQSSPSTPSTPTEQTSEMTNMSDDTSNDSERLEEQMNSEKLDNPTETLSNIANTLIDKSMSEQIQTILTRVNVSTKRNGSAINSYSGRFDVRSVGRDDYKYFVQKNRLGNVKQFAKLHLNLFIDRSGSFSSSEETVNRLLFALRQFEKSNPNFSFDLVTCGVGQTHVDKHERKLKCRGYNFLTDDIFGQFKKLQLPQAFNFNIVLFDGYAFTGCHCDRKKEEGNFAAFNSNNTVIISDTANQSAIEKHAPNAKKTFTNDYVDELCKNVMTALQILTR